jgi:hypothetical protein
MIVAAFLLGVLLLDRGAWATDPEQVCQSGRATAAGRYAKCIQGWVSRYYSGDADPARLGKCVTRYATTYDKLRAKAQASPGSETCDAMRFVDNGDGTVTDTLTALQWEKKTDDSTVHDKDDPYQWSASGTAADGGGFTTFLASLNGAGFAGQYDWRLPTEAELLSITQPAYPNCTTPPCIDFMFGPTVPDFYWSSSTYHPSPTGAWFVFFYDGVPDSIFKTTYGSVRAVRGGF